MYNKVRSLVHAELRRYHIGDAIYQNRIAKKLMVPGTSEQAYNEAIMLIFRDLVLGGYIEQEQNVYILVRMP